MNESQLKQKIAEAVRTTRDTTPLAGSITNAVTMNFVANAQLAVGGSAAMVYQADEAEGLVEMGGAFYTNCGTLMAVNETSIPAAARKARELGKPLVLDPVGIGMGSIRANILKRLKADHPTIVRGNASEIIALAKVWGLDTGADEGSGPRGVDSVDTVSDARAAAVAMARFTGGAVAVSGAEDLVTDGSTVAISHGGSKLMTSVTGMGCSQGGVIAVYAAVAEPFVAALTGVQIYNLAGERAASKAAGTGSMQVTFLDELSNATPQDVAANPFELQEA